MKINKNIKSFKILVLLAMVSIACNNNWEDHYAEDNYDVPAYNIYEYLKSNSELSTFVKMIDLNGYDQLLKSAQTYTVWAPTNEALSEIDLEDSELITQIVQTHVSRNRYTTSGVDLVDINVLSGKNVSFGIEADRYSFGKVPLAESNINTNNGLVHIIENYVPYQKNIWEFIHSDDNIDSLSNYLLENTKSTFSFELSPEIGYNEDGEPIYDSVFIQENEILSQLGAFDIEDSTYTVIIPTDTAWREAYGRISSYYVFPDILGGAMRQNEKTKFNIIKDFAYRELVEDPSDYSELTSTSNGIYEDPEYLFDGASYYELSNGAAYLTDKMPFMDTLSWFKEIRIEAEQELNRENTNSNVYTRSSEGTNFETSNDNYIYVEGTGTAKITSPKVEFFFPEILSATYKIYCVFVPNSIVDEEDLRPMKAKFTLNYIRTSSGRTGRKTLTPEIELTSPTEVTKMYLGEFSFDFANVADEEYPELLTSLLVTSDVNTTETEEYSRDMRIDCIILEPVLK